MAHRIVLALVAVLAAGPVVRAGDPTLPEGASLRLGEVRFRAGGEVLELHFSPDGSELTSRVALGDTRTRTTLWDAAEGLPLAVTMEPRRPGPRVRWSATAIPSTTRGVEISSEGVPVVRDYAAGKDVVRLTGHFARVCAVAVSPDGRRIATASVDGLIRVWEAAKYRPLREAAGHSAAVRSLELAPDGRTLLSLGGDGTARVWDVASGRERRAFAVPPGARVGFTGDGAALRIGSTARDLVTGLEITSPLPGSVAPVNLERASLPGLVAALSPDGRTLAIARSDGSIDLCETGSLQVRRTLAGHAGPCLDLLFTPDGTRLLSASADHSILVWPVRVRDVALTAELKRETDATVLWSRMAYGKGTESYPAMARLAADPDAAVKMAKLCLKPGGATNPVADGRAVELLESLGTLEARALLRELAEEESAAARVRESRAALTRLGDVRYSRDGVRTIGGSKP